MVKVKLLDICLIQAGGTPSRSNVKYWENGTIPWVKISDFKQKYLIETEERISESGLSNSSAKIFSKGTILFTIFATLGEVCILDIDAATNQAIAGIAITSDNVDRNYLYHYLCSKKTYVNSIGRGVAQNNINMGILRGFEILLPSLNEQQRIAKILGKIDELTALRKQQLAKLDELVRARFVEMFGEPVQNSFELPNMPITELCEIVDGDRGKDYPKQEDFFEQGYCLFLNAKNVTSNGFSFDTCMFITEDKDKCLRKGRLCRGDIVLTTRGTIGNLAFYDTSIPFEHMRINSGMVILRINRSLLTEQFFIEQFKMLLPSIKKRVASGSAQPQLPISSMDKIVMMLPDIRAQRDFSEFVGEVTRQKLTIQQSLDKLEVLKKSLMQEYFG